MFRISQSVYVRFAPIVVQFLIFCPRPSLPTSDTHSQVLRLSELRSFLDGGSGVGRVKNEILTADFKMIVATEYDGGVLSKRHHPKSCG